MTVGERARFWRPGREPPGAVVHPDLESVVSRGNNVQVAVAIDISREDVLRVDVIAERNLAREAIRVSGASHNRGCQSTRQRQAKDTNQGTARKHQIDDTE